MKLSITLSVPEKSSPSEFLRFQRQAKKTSELGYDGVELNIRDPRQIDQEAILGVVSSCGLQVSSILTGKVFALDGLSLTDTDRRRRKSAIGRINSHISLAEIMSALVLIGWVRGRWGINKKEARRLLIDSLRRCGEYAEDRGVLLGIEPINRYEVDSIHTVDEAASVVEEAGLPNIGIIPDTFHMNIEESDPIDKAIDRCRGYLFHVHIADNNRKPPGMGHLPFHRFFKVLQAMKYERFTSVEVVPVIPDFETVAEQSVRYLRKIRVV